MSSKKRPESRGQRPGAAGNGDSSGDGGKGSDDDGKGSDDDGLTPVERCIQQAETAMRHGEVDLATSLYWKALEQDPTEIRGYVGMARAALSLGLEKEARIYLDSAERVDPEDPGLKVVQGVWHEAHGERGKALLAYTEAAKSDPGSFTANFNLARLLALSRQYHLAIDHLVAARALAPDEEMVYYHLGLCYRQVGRVAEAIRAFSQVLEVNSLYPDGYLTLVDVFEENKELDAAEVVLLQGLSFLPRHPLLLDRAVGFFMSRGNYGMARMYTEAFLALDPQNERALLNLSAFALLTSDLETAEAASKKVIESNPDSAEAHFGLANLYETVSQLDLAQKHYREAMRCDPKSWRAPNNLGFLLVSSGSGSSQQEGMALLEKARALAPPGELRPVLNLALGYWQTDQRDLALQMAQTVDQQAPQGSELELEAQKLLQAMGRASQQLRVIANVPGARVYVDGLYYGRTSTAADATGAYRVELTPVPAGDHAVVVAASGRRQAEKRVNITEGSVAVVEVQLAEAKNEMLSLSVEADQPGAFAVLDAEVAGMLGPGAPLSILLEQGAHDLAILKAGSDPVFFRRSEWQAGSLRAELKPATETGALNIETSLDVYDLVVDGREILRNIRDKASIPGFTRGKHLVQIRHPELGSEMREILLRSKLAAIRFQIGGPRSNG